MCVTYLRKRNSFGSFNPPGEFRLNGYCENIDLTAAKSASPGRLLIKITLALALRHLPQLLPIYPVVDNIWSETKMEKT